MNEKFNNIISKYNSYEINKIKDFLISEIDNDTLQETIDFIVSDNNVKKSKYNNILYDGDKYKGLFIEGNQYLISSDRHYVYIIDYIGEENDLDYDKTRITFTLSDFIDIINNKKGILSCL